MAEPADINLDDLRRRARRRLVGAVVLALAAVVFVPMLLESDPRPLGEDVSVKIPPVDEGKFVNRLQDKAPSAVMPSKGDAARPGAAKTEPAKAETAVAEPSRTDSAKIEPESSPERKAEPAGKAREQGEAPSNARSADAGRKSLADAEQKVLAAPVKPVSPPQAETPKPAKATAVAPPAPANAGGSGKPPAAKPESAKSDTGKTEAGKTEAGKPAAASTYSVQLAAYSDDKGANALANKLKRAGYLAYTEPLETSKGTLWRVRVGPFPSREAAMAEREKLKGEGQLGIVSPSR